MRTHITRFDLSQKRADYTIITPMTPLAELEAFLERTVFALSKSLLRILLNMCSHLIHMQLRTKSVNLYSQ